MNYASKSLAVAYGLFVSASLVEVRWPQGRALRPAEQLSLRPTTASWGELAALQASLPRAGVAVYEPQENVLELPTIEIPLPRSPQSFGSDGAAQPTPPCAGQGLACEPSSDAGFDSQPDVPDGAGFTTVTPDVAGGVGPLHLVTMLNNQVLIQTRNGDTVGTLDTSIFWSPLGTTPQTPTTTYPRVYFDALAHRWLATIRNGDTSTASTAIFFAISETDDPTGVWDYYALPSDPAAASFADWVVMGYNDTWITITANMFAAPAGATFLGTKMWTIDKSTALAGGPLTVSVFPTGFMSTVHGSGGSSVHPARTFDADPTLWLVNDTFTHAGTFLLQLTRITGTGAAPVVSGLPGSPFGGTTSLCYTDTNWSGTQLPMTQLGEARTISPFSIRIASVAVRCGKIWAANSGGLPGPSTNTVPSSNGILWREIDPTLPFPAAPGTPGSMLVQDGAVTNGTGTMSAYPSIAVNRGEDVLLGYANADSTRSPRACYSLRLGTDAPGLMGPVEELKAGDSAYWKGPGVVAPYGRYSSAAVDPTDDLGLWTLQEHADQRIGPADDDSRWGTRWLGLASECMLLNGGFETGTIPTSISQITNAPSWTTANSGTSDYFAVGGTGGAGVPSNWAGSRTPHAGNAYAGIATYVITFGGLHLNYREYLQSPLSRPLTAGTPYLVKLWVCRANGMAFDLATDQMGIRFGLTSLQQGDDMNLAVTPDYEYPGVITDSEEWTPIEFVFHATGGERYIVIGNFNDNAGTTVEVLGSSTTHAAYYYVDDVSVCCYCDSANDDHFEDNDSCATAAFAQPFTSWTSLYVSKTDSDWYRLAVPAKSKVVAHTTFTHSDGNIDMRLYDACNGVLIASSSTANDGEVVTWKNLGTLPRHVFLEVYVNDASSSDCNQYSFSWWRNKIKKK